jgi:cell division protein ZapA (FtsZ GTPase activity inhibitor)
MGANETRNFARVLKSTLPDSPVQKNKTYQKILALNKVITKMDGARIIALEKANTSYYDQANIEQSMSVVAGNVLDELQSTEKELSDETEMEIEDEIEADRKIRDAKTRNYKAAVKTTQALKKIEGYLKQLENDENKLRSLNT